MHWYKRDPDAALAGMAELTNEECGVYNRIIDLLYARDGDVVDDDRAVARMINNDIRVWIRIKQQLIDRKKIWVLSGKIMARRVEDTLKNARMFSEHQAEVAAKRWEKHNKNNPTVMPTGNPSTTTTTTTTTKKDSCSSDDERLRVFWEAYPRKVGKKAAEKAFKKAITETTLDVMLKALEIDKGNWREERFTPHPATWLNQGRYLDHEPTKSKPFYRPPIKGNGHVDQRQDPEKPATKAEGLLDEGTGFRDEDATGLGDRRGWHS